MRSLITYWQLDGPMAIFLLITLLVYFYLTGFRLGNKSAYFFIGYGLIIFSVASPLHFLGENYLMSAHMLAHVMLLLIAAPCLVMGIPENSPNRFLRRFSDKLSRVPLLCWTAGVSIMWFWHIPIVFNHLFDTAGSIHINPYPVKILQDVHMVSLVLAGILFSWPVIGPFPSKRIAPLNAVLYLSAACVFCSILGLLITFAPMGVYTPYMQVTDHFGFLNMIRNEEGITVVMDQQIGGLIMWVPGCLIYLSASMFLLMKWFREKKQSPALTNNLG
jgi:putative membrane protein